MEDEEKRELKEEKLKNSEILKRQNELIKMINVLANQNIKHYTRI